MNLMRTTQPNGQQKKDMELLLASCKDKEPLLLSIPQAEDGLEADFLLLYDNATLAAMAYVCFPDDSMCECFVLVEPARRKQGLFRHLLDHCLDFAEACEKKAGHAVDFCFLVDENTPSAAAVMEAIGAEYWYSEYKLTRDLTAKDQDMAPDPLVIRYEGENLYSALLEDKVIGTCAVLPSGSEYYLYAFQIHKDFQAQGYGKKFLSGMLSLLARKAQKVSLQVSGTNYIARNLYKKTGFRTSEALSYYLY